MQEQRAASPQREAPLRPLPVTLLSGFLGSGKTSLLTHILQSKASTLRVALIVNEITSINMDVLSLQGSKLLHAEERMVEMSNGCICCTLRMDLLARLRELHASGSFDAVIIESSGIADPMEVAETFFVEIADPAHASSGSSPVQVLQEFAPLDACVSVVDVSTLMGYMQSTENVAKLQEAKATPLQDGRHGGAQGGPAPPSAAEDGAVPQEDERPICELLFSQLEFANIIVANKMDLLAPPERDAALALLKTLNPHAKILPSSFGRVDLRQILRTQLFNEDFAKAVSTQWKSDINNPAAAPHLSETEEYRVSTCTFCVPGVPFHPKRLHDWITAYFVLNEVLLQQPATAVSSSWKAAQPAKDAARIARYGQLLRGKGVAWLGNPRRDDIFVTWSQCGAILTFASGGYWDEYPWAASPLQVKHQQLVFVGRDLRRDVLLADLQALLLTGEEQKQLAVVMGQLEADSDDEEASEDADAAPASSSDVGSDGEASEASDADVFADPFAPFFADDDADGHDDDAGMPPGADGAPITKKPRV